MRLTVITPVGPGHEIIVRRAKRSVLAAAHGPFTSIEHIVIDDTAGSLGRSRARNLAADRTDAEWLFYLDADDYLRPDALTSNDFDAPATFGAISLDGRLHERNVWPCTWADIARSSSGTLSMGFFCRADLGLRFNEALDAGEDFEFYLRLPGFTKRRQPLVEIGYDVPSARGPRGYRSLDWIAACDAQVKRAILREPEKFDLGHHAVLAPG